MSNILSSKHEHLRWANNRSSALRGTWPLRFGSRNQKANTRAPLLINEHQPQQAAPGPISASGSAMLEPHQRDLDDHRPMTAGGMDAAAAAAEEEKKEEEEENISSEQVISAG